MNIRPKPEEAEHRRLKSLKNLDILDTDCENVFDDLTRLVSRIYDAPIVALSLVDLKRQWFKSKVGLDVSETPRDISFCTYAIEQDDCYVIEDATLSEIHRSSPLVTQAPHIRFYAGAPVYSLDGEKVGTICVIDRVPRKFTSEQKALLKIFAQQISKIFELRKKNQLKSDLIKRQDEIEKELSSLIRQLHVVIEHVPANIVATDLAGKIRFANKGFCRMLELNEHPKNLVGYSLVSVLEESCKKELISKNDLINSQKLALSEMSSSIEPFVLSNGCSYEGDFVKIKRGETTFGNLWCYRETTQDIITKKTIEIQQLQLAESAKLKSLGEMAAGLAHEINNPLTTIQGRVTHVLSMANSGQLHHETVIKYMNHINVVVERIVKIIRGLKSFARGGENDEIESVNLSKVIEDTLSFCQTKMAFLGIELMLPSFDCEILVLCRPHQASQVLLNLLNNACDAIENSEIKWIRIDLVQSAGSAAIIVSNSGQKIDHAIVERIFDPFFTTKSSDRGTGMGLSISKRIAENNAGRLYLDEASEYTSFVFQLPLFEAIKSA